MLYFWDPLGIERVPLWLLSGVSCGAMRLCMLRLAAFFIPSAILTKTLASESLNNSALFLEIVNFSLCTTITMTWSTLATVQYAVSLSFIGIHLFIMDMYPLMPLTHRTISSALILVSLASRFQSCSSSLYLGHCYFSVSLHCFSWDMYFVVVVWLTFPFLLFLMRKIIGSDWGFPTNVCVSCSCPWSLCT